MTDDTKEGDKKPYLFQPGHPAHPKAGRPKGSKNKKTIIEAAVQTALVNQLEQDAMEIYHKAVELAKDGDRQMIRMFMERLLPALKLAGEGDGNKSTGGIQIVINSTAENKEKTVSGPVTINQLPNPEEEDENE